MKLPPLPEPDVRDPYPFSPDDGSFSEDAMQAYARAAVLAERERCAALCDRLAYEDTTCQGDMTDLYKFGEAIRAKGE